MGPKNAQGGDKVCILAGLDLPCLLRPNRINNGTVIDWEFVEVCYVEGLMHGEGLVIESQEKFVVV